MITIRKTAHCAWPVTVTLQHCDAATGEVSASEHRFIGHFKPLSEAERKAIHDEVEAAFPVPEGDEARLSLPTVLERNAVLFPRLMVGWDKVTDEAGVPVAFSAQTLKEWACGPDGLAVSAGLNTAINELRFGLAPAKNSPPSPAPGQDSGQDGGKGATSAS